MTVRPAAVAGLFYPARPEELERTVDGLLAAAHPPAMRPKVLVVPHAGYVYSGAVAASAYATLAPLRDSVRRVVLLGPTHHMPVRGLATTAAVRFRTPLGDVTIDRTVLETVVGLPQVVVDEAAHAMEHALEVQLPFLQRALGEFSLAPFAVGDASDEEVAEVLDRLWGGHETLLVISSDLSHYLPYAEAQRRDRATVDAILRLAHLASFEQACGATPINGLLRIARHRDLRPQLLALCNSGDTGGARDKGRVVGYAAFAFEEPSHAAA